MDLALCNCTLFFSLSLFYFSFVLIFFLSLAAIGLGYLGTGCFMWPFVGVGKRGLGSFCAMKIIRTNLQ
ncbi:hypothetical protein SLEP1_g48556 [Rubroshorea leprosula]|uniref:NADH dehydrogenase subunit 4L n=1 Tax=Rubroshorea leprosula TaxID=152421 RepID=A0AAV5LU02_9ROSI|nr:hypothetical protein SLEP1_g48556 [Rubroshorea leprosula]